MKTSKVLLIVTVVLVLWGLITHGTHAGEGDEPHCLTMAHSLAFDHDLDLTNDIRRHLLSLAMIGITARSPAHTV